MGTYVEYPERPTQNFEYGDIVKTCDGHYAVVREIGEHEVHYTCCWIGTRGTRSYRYDEIDLVEDPLIESLLRAKIRQRKDKK